MASASVTRRGQTSASLRRPSTRAPMTTPAMYPAKAVPERSASRPWTRPAARPSSTMLPVMFAVKTRPRPR